MPRNNSAISQFGKVLQALLISLSFIIILGYFFEIYWETNDDIAMSMIAHGYGLASTSSSNLFFSNVIWGGIVHTIPSINGILGYSIATLAITTITGAVIFYSLRRHKVGFTVSLLILILVLLRPTLFPQFTINAGLLYLNAFICIHLYAENNHYRYLLAAFIFSLVSYWIRDIEFFFVLLVSLPLIPWKQLLNKASIITIIIFLIFITISTYIDKKSYQESEWQSFTELNSARAPITDYGADLRLLKQPQLLEKYNYSSNDIRLIRNWFFVDPSIANPNSLNQMLRALEPASDKNSSLKALKGLLILIKPPLIVLTLTSLLILLINPNWKLALAWIIFILMIIAISLLGRGGISRIYVPVLSMLVVAPILLFQFPFLKKKYFIISISLLMLFNSYMSIASSITLNIEAKKIQKGLMKFSHSPIVLWGSSFPLRAVFPVKNIPSIAMTYQLFGLGVFTHAPFFISYQEQLKGKGFIKLFTSQKGIVIVANANQIKLLSIYCNEHFNGNLIKIDSQKNGGITLSRYQCRSVSNTK